MNRTKKDIHCGPLPGSGIRTRSYAWKPVRPGNPGVRQNTRKGVLLKLKFVFAAGKTAAGAMVYKPQTTTPPARPGRPICSIASSFCDAQQEPEQGRILKAYFATLEEQAHEQVDAKRKKSTIYTAQFRRALQAIPGRRIWLIVETAGLEGVSVAISIRCAKTDELMALNDALTLVHNGTEQQGFEVTIGDWNGGGRYQHTEMYRNWAIAELEPGPASATECKTWAKKLEACTDHRALFYVEARARTGIPTDYANEDPQRQGITQDKGIFMNEAGKYLELLSCCRADITFTQLKEVFPGAPADKIQGVADEFNRSYTVNGVQQKLFEIFHVDSCLRRAHFFAQAKVESKLGTDSLGGALKGESLNYAITALLEGRPLACFASPHFPHLRGEAIRIGRGPYKGVHPITGEKIDIPATQKADEKRIANIGYMDRYRDQFHKLGNVNDGDGWNFRGRGMLQLSGRSNYQSIQTHLDNCLPGNGADLMNITDDLTIKQALISGLAFWHRTRSFLAADRGASDAHVDRITKIINLSTDSYTARKNAFHLTSNIFSISICLSRQ